MRIVIDIPNGEIPKKQEYMEIGLHFIDGTVCECTYPFLVIPKGHGDLIDKKVAYRKFYSRCYAKLAEEVFSKVPTVIPADKGD